MAAYARIFYFYYTVYYISVIIHTAEAALPIIDIVDIKQGSIVTEGIIRVVCRLNIP